MMRNRTAQDEEKKYRDTSLTFEKGFIVYDDQWQPVLRDESSVELTVRKDRTYVDLYRFEVHPESYNIAFHAQPLETNFLGGWKFTREVASYGIADLQMSDVQLASRIEPTVDTNQFVKNNLLVVPNPAKVYSRVNPVYLYFELYNLGGNDKGITDYAIEYALNRTEDKGKGVKNLFGLLGGKNKTSLFIRTEREGNEGDFVEYTTLDVSNVEPGEYTLTVTAIDNIAGGTASKTLQLTLR